MNEYAENKIKIERSILWKMYFVLFVCLNVLGVGILFSEENFGIIEIIDLPMTLISIIGLYGYVFSKRIHKQSFWFSFFWVYLVFSFVYPFLREIEFLAHDPELSDAENKFLNIFVIVTMIPLILPAYIGLLLYALPSNKLWKNIN
tara:strand:+ start:33 stop:470 length:438 start_codon:yes stop_codon:yes gene_type:complete